MEKFGKKTIQNRQMSQELMKKFIIMYKAHPNLWKTDSDNYRNKALKAKSYTALIKLISSEIPNADVKFIAKKINTIRVCFRKEYRKCLEKTDYKPMLWYYDLLSFIVNENSDNNDFYDDDTRSFEINGKTETSNSSLAEGGCKDEVIGSYNEEFVDTEMYYETINDNYSERVIDSPISIEEKNNYKNIDFTIKTEKHKRKYNDNEPTLGSDSQYRVSPVNFQKISHFNFDEFDTFGHYISKKLKKIASKNHDQHIFCENIINQAMTKAQLGKLSENSYISC